MGWENWIERFQNWRNFDPFLKGGQFGRFFSGRSSQNYRKHSGIISRNSRLHVEQAIFSECGGWRKATGNCLIEEAHCVSQDYSKHPPNSEMHFCLEKTLDGFSR